MNKTIKSTAGFATVTVLMVILLLSLLAVGGLSIVNSMLKSTGTQLAATKAEHLAEDGAKWYVQQLVLNGSNIITTSSSELEYTQDDDGINGSVTITTTGGANQAEVTVIAKVFGDDARQNVLADKTLTFTAKYATKMSDLTLFAANDIKIDASSQVDGRVANSRATGKFEFPSATIRNSLFPYAYFTSSPDELKPPNSSLGFLNRDNYSGEQPPDSSWNLGDKYDKKYFVPGGCSITASVSGKGVVYVDGDVEIAASFATDANVAIISTGYIKVLSSTIFDSYSKVLLVSGTDMQIYAGITGAAVCFGDLTVYSPANVTYDSTVYTDDPDPDPDPKRIYRTELGKYAGPSTTQRWMVEMKATQ